MNRLVRSWARPRLEVEPFFGSKSHGETFSAKLVRDARSSSATKISIC